MMPQTHTVIHETWPVNSVNLHVALAGEGPPLILLHGFPELWYSWRKIIPLLDGRYRLIMPDLRGYGDSDIPETGYDLDTLAADVAGLIDRAGGRAAVVSHDWGGLVGWHTAISHPDKVESLVVAAGPHMARHAQVLRTSPKQVLMGLYTVFFQLPFLPEWLLSTRNGLLTAAILRLSAVRPGTFTPADMAVYRKAWAKRASMRAGINYYRQLRADLPRIIRYYHHHKVPCPVCVIWADKDRFLSVDSARKLDRWCDFSPKVHILENCGHWIAQEAPEEMATVITEFLDK